MKKIAIFLSVTVLLINGCAGSPIYKEVFKQDINYNSKEFPVSMDILYDATIRAICSKNFIIEKEDKENGFILAKRSLQRGKRTTILALQAKITANQENKSMLYLNALLNHQKDSLLLTARGFLCSLSLYPEEEVKKPLRLKRERK
jgi:hypothetical protein